MLHSSGEKNRRTTVTAVGRALVIVCLVPPGTGAAAAGAAARQPRPVPSEKEARTPAQGKINSQILYEIYRRRGEAIRKGVPPGPTGVDVDARGRALVDVRAEVTPALQKTIRSLGGVITSSSSEHHSIMARVPLLKLEQLAGDSAVRFIEPVARATTNHAK
jgi:hypothetical protein